mmetsp:Transcript_30705/g.76692  ORF Transcript_30705/g.76692 Transcript_30705/m.76692 type:complete len:102 (-) Transcript_30705:75-380(-)
MVLSPVPYRRSRMALSADHQPSMGRTQVPTPVSPLNKCPPESYLLDGVTAAHPLLASACLLAGTSLPGPHFLQLYRLLMGKVQERHQRPQFDTLCCRVLLG